MLAKFLDWVHRMTVITGESCIRRNCKEFHGTSPSLSLIWSIKKNDFGLLGKGEQHE